MLKRKFLLPLIAATALIPAAANAGLEWGNWKALYDSDHNRALAEDRDREFNSAGLMQYQVQYHNLEAYAVDVDFYLRTDTDDMFEGTETINSGGIKGAVHYNEIPGDTHHWHFEVRRHQ